MARAPATQQSTPEPTQQRTLEPERLGDVEAGAEAPESEVDDLGLTSSERAEWDAMEAEAKGKAPPEPEPAEGDAGDGEADADGQPKPPIVADAEDDDDEPAPAGQKKPGATISRHKHTRELNKRDTELQALRDRLAQRDIDWAKANERLTILNEALTAPPPVDPAVAQQQAVAENPWLEPTIKVEDDAIAAIAQMQRRQDFNNRQQSQQFEQIQETEADRNLRETFNSDIQRYAAQPADQNPDAPFFGDAYSHLKNSRLTEISISLFDKDPNDPKEQFSQAELSRIIADFNSEEKWVVSNALDQKKSPAAAIMKLARGRGWKRPDPQGRPAAPAARTNGAAPPAARPPAAAARPANGTAVDKLNAEIEGAAAARSLSDGGGAPPQPALDIESLLKMDDEEFGLYVDRLPKGRLDAIMGKVPERQMN
jgi:hypothetical protein